MNETSRPRLWYSRGYLPHYDGGQIIQFVTFRLADSLPQNVIDAYRNQVEQKIISVIEYHRKIDKYLDAGNGTTYLTDGRIAQSIEETLYKFNGEKYKLHSWVIMPNHVHLLLAPLENVSLATILHSIKSFTAGFANKLLDRKGRFWSPEYFDRYIRDHEHYEKTVAYIENNPVKAGLCKKPNEWRFGSAAGRNL